MPDQVQQDYKVRLDSFEGPLDLLLFLVRRSEVDLHDIPIGKITDQYLSLLSHAEKVDVELAGEFLVMAATLVEIKSRTIAPPETQEEHDGAEAEGSIEDPRADLIRQLLRYRAYASLPSGSMTEESGSVGSSPRGPRATSTTPCRRTRSIWKMFTSWT